MLALGSRCKNRRSFVCLPTAHLLRCGPVPHGPWTATGPGPEGWWPLIYTVTMKEGKQWMYLIGTTNDTQIELRLQRTHTWWHPSEMQGSAHTQLLDLRLWTATVIFIYTGLLSLFFFAHLLRNVEKRREEQKFCGLLFLVKLESFEWRYYGYFLKTISF